MPAPKGNKYAIGNRGGGRKSAYHETTVAEALRNAFIKGVDLNKLEATVNSGKFRLTDLMLLKAIGSEKMLLELTKKVLPDNLGGEPPTIDFSAEAKKRLQMYIVS